MVTSEANLESLIDALNHALNRFAYSTASYLLETNPYTTDKDKAAVGAVTESAGIDRELAQECIDLIDELEGIPRNGIPNPEFAELNYLSYPYLLDVLIRCAADDLKLLKEAQTQVGDHEAAKGLIDKMIKAREAQSKKFTELRSSYE